MESDLAENLHDALNAEIVVGTITSKQDAVDWMTWTFLYRRLAPNPNYYNLSGRSAQHINDFLSQLIEDTVEDLQNAKEATDISHQVKQAVDRSLMLIPILIQLKCHLSVQAASVNHL